MSPDQEIRLLSDQARALGLRFGPGIGEPLAAGVLSPTSRIQQEIKPWWLDFPRDGRYFDRSGIIATPALGSSLTTVLSFTAEPGWDGVIRAISQNYTGGGFVQGSGDLTWTIRRAGAVEVEYNAKAFELGDVKDPTETEIIFHENELIEYLVSVSATAGIPIAGTFIICRMKGWMKPRGL
jgi:hypothetical protein